MQKAECQTGYQVVEKAGPNAGQFVCNVQTCGWDQKRPPGSVEFHFGGAPVTPDQLKWLLAEFDKK